MYHLCCSAPALFPTMHSDSLIRSVPLVVVLLTQWLCLSLVAWVRREWTPCYG